MRRTSDRHFVGFVVATAKRLSGKHTSSPENSPKSEMRFTAPFRVIT